MFKNLVKTFILPTGMLAAVLIFTMDDLKFHLSAPTPLSPEAASSVRRLSLNQIYELAEKMRYKVDVANAENRQGTLLWPAEPYSTFMVLVPTVLETVDPESRYTGRIVRCPYNCEIGEMQIDMESFRALILKHFPEYAEHNSLLPRFILDTQAKPLGFGHYLNTHRVPFFVAGVFYLIATRFFVKNSLPGVRPPVGKV